MELTKPNHGIPVVFDTNFLLLPFQRRVDVFGEVERLLEEPHYLVVVKQTLDELKGLSARHKKDSPAARAALALIETKSFEIEGGFEGNADAAIVKMCAAVGSEGARAVVCTNDRRLRDRLKKLGGRVCVSRDKGHLGLV